MQRFHRCLLLAPAVALACWNLAPRSPISAGDAPAAGGSRFRLPNFNAQGVGSCSAAACHNGNGPQGSKGSEYSTWITVDPHAKAYSVLFDKRSKRIVENLKETTAAERNGRCLSCHAMPEADRNSRVRIEDGVGCESCHGPAQKWLTQHYLPEWKQKGDDQKAALGMRRTKDLQHRANMCADCHVGSPGRDVNHDLIAAGHPRLSFEFSAYLAILPKHWSERDEKQRYPDFEVRAWAIGQVASARAALQLLADRARDEKKPWPEFAEYDCFACHHDLREPSWRQKRGYTGRVPGSFPWGSWYYSMTATAVATRGSEGDKQVLPALQKLRDEMKKPSPARKQVSKEAHVAAEQLDQCLPPRNPYGPEAIQQLLRSVRQDAKQAETWDQEAQRYLAAAALYHALADLGGADPEDRASIQSMGKPLAFPKGYASPRDFDPAMLQRTSK